jgi:hypothetical protein
MDFGEVGELFFDIEPNRSHNCIFTSTTHNNPIPTNMLHIIGLGLADERDISVKGLEIVKKAERVYLEAYTAVLLVDQSVLVRIH